MLVLTNGYNSFDFSRFVTSYNFSVEPAFEYHELLNGTISKKFDLGYTSDKFFCDLDLAIDFTTSQAFYVWYENTKGLDLTISTELDLFFPNVYSYSSCIVSEIRDGGYLGSDIMTAIKIIKMRLLLKQTPSYNTSAMEPPCFYSKGIWSGDYKYSDKTLHSSYGYKTSFVNFKNDMDEWVVDFSLLTKSETFDIVSWILYERTRRIVTTRNNINANTHNKWKEGETVYYWQDEFNIRSFSFTNLGNHYSGHMNLVGVSNRF